MFVAVRNCAILPFRGTRIGGVVRVFSEVLEESNPHVVRPRRILRLRARSKAEENASAGAYALEYLVRWGEDFGSGFPHRSRR